MNSWGLMGKNDKNGHFVIDELRLCYTAEPSLLEDLSSIPSGYKREYGNYTLFRTRGDRFKFLYTVFQQGSRQEIGVIKFGRYAGDDDRYVYYKVNNRCLYDAELLESALSLPEILKMQFNNFTAIDIALDHNKNFTSIIKRMIRNKEITTIINGRVVTDRKNRRFGMGFYFPTSLDRLLPPSFTLAQAKAKNNKEKGITVQSYNKKEEIAASNKQYILDYYQHPRFLFRLEVRLRYQELSDYFKKIGRAQSIEILFDPGLLQDMFYYHLSSVLRFRKGRRQIAWRDIILCNGRV